MLQGERRKLHAMEYRWRLLHPHTELHKALQPTRTVENGAANSPIAATATFAQRVNPALSAAAADSKSTSVLVSPSESIIRRTQAELKGTTQSGVHHS
jgi:hypothetical protein